MFDDYSLTKLAKIRQEELREEARIERLLSGSRTFRTSLRYRLLSRGANFLIHSGQWLRERYEPRIDAQFTLQRPYPEEAPCD